MNLPVSAVCVHAGPIQQIDSEWKCGDTQFYICAHRWPISADPKKQSHRAGIEQTANPNDAEATF